MSDTWLDLARDARRAANSLVGENLYRSTVARAYYAVYSRVAHELMTTVGLAMPAQREGAGHKKLRPMIEAHMPNMVQVRRDKLSELVGRLYTMRVDADYKPSTQVDAREAREALSIMKTIFESF